MASVAECLREWEELQDGFQRIQVPGPGGCTERGGGSGVGARPWGAGLRGCWTGVAWGSCGAVGTERCPSGAGGCCWPRGGGAMSWAGSAALHPSLQDGAGVRRVIPVSEWAGIGTARVTRGKARLTGCAHGASLCPSTPAGWGEADAVADSARLCPDLGQGRL